MFPRHIKRMRFFLNGASCVFISVVFGMCSLAALWGGMVQIYSLYARTQLRSMPKEVRKESAGEGGMSFCLWRENRGLRSFFCFFA